MNPAIHSVQGNVIRLYDRRSLDQVLSDVDVAIDRDRARRRELALIEKLTREREEQPSQYAQAELGALGLALLVLAGLALHILAVSPA